MPDVARLFSSARCGGARAGLLLLCASALACGHAGTAQAAPALKVLFSFTNLRGAVPVGTLLADGAGNLFGSAYGGGANGDGVVFELSPPVAGHTAWTERVRHSFNGAGGKTPSPGLIADGAGNLYGTSYAGGANDEGVVFELRPPAGGEKAWTEKVLFSFDGADGLAPYAGLTADNAGNLYGTTSFGGARGEGVVFELSPPAPGKTIWTETVLHSFDGTNGRSPVSRLIADGAGNFYGTTPQGGGVNRSCNKGCGVVFELSPPAPRKTTWTETVLFSFNGADGQQPPAGLIADATGNLYGTAASGGAHDAGLVFELSPPPAGQTAWTESVLHAFDGADGLNPDGGLTADSAGHLYGTTMRGGTKSDGVLFELSPPAGLAGWTLAVLHAFSGADGSLPVGELIADSAGNLYGTTEEGGAHDDGVAFRLTP